MDKASIGALSKDIHNSTFSCEADRVIVVGENSLYFESQSLEMTKLKHCSEGPTMMHMTGDICRQRCTAIIYRFLIHKLNELMGGVRSRFQRG